MQAKENIDTAEKLQNNASSPDLRYGALETLQLPAAINQKLSGPLSDLLEADQMLKRPSIFALVITVPQKKLQDDSAMRSNLELKNT
jgi:hypothetical protein